jgi:sugar O-acyltransferase (sialic acid O-acetyltransferase NeuD family)
MYLYGAGGHAKVIIDILQNSGVVLFGLFDDSSELKELNGCKVLSKYTGQSLEEPLIISIGNNSIRAKIANQLNTPFGNAIHTSAIISPSATIGKGTVVMQGAIVQASTIVGAHVIINTKASVDHDCTIGDFVHVSPGAVLCGHVQVGEGTLIGAGSVIIPSVKIGKWCIVGAGAVITKDLPDFATVVCRGFTTK